MAKDNEDLYQALFSKEFSNREKAKKWLVSVNNKRTDSYTKLYYSLLANYGGEPFSEKEFGKILQNTKGILLNPGSTAKSILEKLVEYKCLHKLE